MIYGKNKTSSFFILILHKKGTKSSQKNILIIKKLLSSFKSYNFTYFLHYTDVQVCLCEFCMCSTLLYYYFFVILCWRPFSPLLNISIVPLTPSFTSIFIYFSLRVTLSFYIRVCVFTFTSCLLLLCEQRQGRTKKGYQRPKKKVTKSEYILIQEALNVV
jgi:hypothetical protein